MGSDAQTIIPERHFKSAVLDARNFVEETAGGLFRYGDFSSEQSLLSQSERRWSKLTK